MLSEAWRPYSPYHDGMQQNSQFCRDRLCSQSSQNSSRCIGPSLSSFSGGHIACMSSYDQGTRLVGVPEQYCRQIPALRSDGRPPVHNAVDFVTRSRPPYCGWVASSMFSVRRRDCWHGGGGSSSRGCRCWYCQCSTGPRRCISTTSCQHDPHCSRTEAGPSCQHQPSGSCTSWHSMELPCHTACCSSSPVAPHPAPHRSSQSPPRQLVSNAPPTGHRREMRRTLAVHRRVAGRRCADMASDVWAETHSWNCCQLHPVGLRSTWRVRRLTGEWPFLSLQAAPRRRGKHVPSVRRDTAGHPPRESALVTIALSASFLGRLTIYQVLQSMTPTTRWSVPHPSLRLPLWRGHWWGVQRWRFPGTSWHGPSACWHWSLAPRWLGTEQQLKLAYQRLMVATPHAPRWLTRGHSLSRSLHLMLHTGLPEATVYHGGHTSCSTLAYQRPQSITVATPNAPHWLTRGHSLSRSPHLVLHAGLPEATVYHGRHTSCSTLAYQRPQSITVATPHAPRWLIRGHSLSRSLHLMLHAGLPEATVYHGRHTSCSTLAYQRPQSITVATPRAPHWLTRGHSLSRWPHLMLHTGLPEATVYHGHYT